MRVGMLVWIICRSGEGPGVRVGLLWMLCLGGRSEEEEEAKEEEEGRAG